MTRQRKQRNTAYRRACGLALSVAGVWHFSPASAQFFNPTVLAPPAAPPVAREARVAVTRGQRGLVIPADAAKRFVTVRSVVIDGAFPELAEQNAALASRLQGARLSVADVYQATAELQAAYAKAYPLAYLSTPDPYFSNGVVHLGVTDGFIGKIEIVGARAQTVDLLRARLDPLVGQRHLTAAEFERRTMLLGTVAGVTGMAKTAPGPGSAEFVLTFETNESPITGGTVISNRLPKQFGTWEFSQSFAVNNSLGLGEQISGAVASTPDFDRYFDGTAKSQSYSTDVAVPIGANGLVVGASYVMARTRATPLLSTLPGEYLTLGERVAGRFDRVNARAAYPLFLTNDLTLRVQASVDHTNYRNRFEPFPLGFVDPAFFLGPVNDITRDRYVAARFGAEGSYRLPWLPSVTVSGLILYARGLGGRLDSSDYLFGPHLSRIGADTAFNRLNVKARVDVALPEQFQFTAIGRAQTNFGRPLMITENFRLDGFDAVSGYAAGTLNADRGVTARAELSRPVVFSLLDYNHVVSPYVFGAWGSGIIENVNAGAYRHFWVSTYGGGLRADTSFTGSLFGETLALEFGRDVSNIPFRQTGYRTNVNYNIRFAGDPFAPDAAAPTPTGIFKKGPPVAPAPLLWQGFYAGLNAGYTWDPRPTVTMAGAPVRTEIDGFLAAPIFSYWGAGALGANGVSLAAGGGFSGGAQIGYNVQANRFVVGVESDIQGSNDRTRHSLASLNVGSSLLVGAPPVPQTDAVNITAHHEKNVDWLGTARGRVGFLVAPTLLAYGTGGFAYGGARANTFVEQNWSGDGPLGPLLQSSGAVGRYSGTRTGWTIGAGLEWMFAPNASLKAEYLHYDLGSVNYALSPLVTTLPTGNYTYPSPPPSALVNSVASYARTQFRGDIGRVGLNYHFGGGGVDFASPPPAAFATGFYAGLNAGFGWDASRQVVTTAAPAVRMLDQTHDGNTLGLAAAQTANGVVNAAANGALGGGQAGFNYVLDRYVVGAEADLQGAAQHGRGGFGAQSSFSIAGIQMGNTQTSAAVEKTLDWFGTLRARAGFLVTPSIMAFASGGLAYGGVTLQNQVAHVSVGAPFYQSIGDVSHISETKVGWTVGGGVEWRFTPAMSLKAEYLYFNLGHANSRGSIADVTADRANAITPPVFFMDRAALTTGTRFSGQIARLGLNYHFDPIAPVPLLGK
ncbi:MAG: outer membrane beta-barrel protein [Methylocystis sp.]|uniref:outer membrane beta-barrel protein n=1 Tax=Methylocystis sp. TaxID=1911079 RepID=UPI003DA435AE